MEAQAEPGSWYLMLAPAAVGAGLAPGRACLGPCCGVVPGWSHRRRSRAAWAAVLLRVLTRSLTRPICRNVRCSTRESAGARELFTVDANTSPCRSEVATPGSVRVCVCACVFAHPGVLPWLSGLAFRVCVVVLPCPGVLAGSRRPTSRARSSPPHRLGCRLIFFWAHLACSCPCCCCCCCFRCPPLVSAFLIYLALGALGLGALWLPPRPLFFFRPRLSPPFRCFGP